MNKSLLSVIAFLLLLASGCISMEFMSPGRKANEPLYDGYCWACLWFNCWWWWSDDPSEVCKITDRQATTAGDGYVYRPGYREIKISHSWWTVFPAFATLGAITPLKVIVYMTKDNRPQVKDEEAFELK